MPMLANMRFKICIKGRLIIISLKFVTIWVATRGDKANCDKVWQRGGGQKSVVGRRHTVLLAPYLLLYLGLVSFLLLYLVLVSYLHLYLTRSLSYSFTWCRSFYLILYPVLVSFLLLYVSVILLPTPIPYTGLFFTPLRCAGLFLSVSLLPTPIYHTLVSFLLLQLFTPLPGTALFT